MNHRFNFAIFTETVFGRRTYQAFGLAGEDWLPVDYPKDGIDEAKFDCNIAQQELNKRGIVQPFLLDPDLRMFEWSGPRRMLK